MAVSSIWDAILEIKGVQIKRVVRYWNQFTILMFHGGNIFAESTIDFLVYIGGVLVLWGILSYFSSTTYTVCPVSIGNLVDVLENTINKVEGDKFERIDAGEEIKFINQDGRKSIRITEIDTFFSKRHFYFIKFKRWKDPLSRKEIVKALRMNLQKEQTKRWRNVSPILQIVFTIIFAAFFMMIVVNRIMEPGYYLLKRFEEGGI